MVSVTADTNIDVSALNNPSGVPMGLLKLAQMGSIRIDISDAIMNETLGVLSRKFGFTNDDLKEAESLINTLTHRVKPTIALDVVKSDPTDNRILECAEAANSDFIISGDKRLLRLQGEADHQSQRLSFQ